VNRVRSLTVLAFFTALLTSGPARPQGTTVQLLANDGAVSETLSGSLHARETRRFQLDGHAGQRLDIRLTRAGRFLYVKVTDPDGESMFDGVSKTAQVYSAHLSRDGPYTVEVYRPRGGGDGRFTLAVAISGGASAVNCGRLPKPDRMVCTDPALTTLDHRLAEVYRRAQTRVKTRPALAQLQRDQADWLGVRRRCVGDFSERSCLKRAYDGRIAYLEAEWALIPGQAPIIYRCGLVRPPIEITATYVPTTPPSAVLKRNRDRVVAVAQPANIGTRYVAPGGVQFWTRGADALVDWGPARNATCQGRPD
jgi:uncharacterized protein